MVKNVMNAIARMTFLPALLTLAGCSGETPDCSAGDTLNLLTEIAEEHFQKSAYARQLRPLVEYEFRNIRTEDYNEKLDTYQCSATLEIYLKGTQSKEAQKREIKYTIHSVEDRDADFEITYSNIQETILRAAMAKSLGWK